MIQHSTAPLNTRMLATSIVRQCAGDPRIAYEFLDMLNKHVGEALKGAQEGKQ